MAAKEAALPPEPSIHDENTVALQVKMPDGSQRGRNFLKSDRLQVKKACLKSLIILPRNAFTLNLLIILFFVVSVSL